MDSARVATSVVLLAALFQASLMSETVHFGAISKQFSFQLKDRKLNNTTDTLSGAFFVTGQF